MSMDDIKYILNDQNQYKSQTLKYPSPSSDQMFNYMAFEFSHDDSPQLLPEVISQSMEAENIAELSIVKRYSENKTHSATDNDLKPNFKIIERQCPQNQPMKLGQKRNISTQMLKKTHPTKNLLTTFKKAHLQYLSKKIPNIIKKSTVYKTLIEKKNMSLKDYEDLYNDDELFDALKLFFKNKELYRALMTSRVNLEQRKIYLRYIHRFQQAFNEKQFRYIGIF